jgi:photosystem II stability/assembly factor-like uncharacterized protein
MLRSLSIAAGLTGVATALSLACSGTVDPSPEISRSSSRGGNQGSSSNSPRQASSPTLTPQQSGTLNRLQAVSPVNHKIVWASGLNGTFVVTTDGGDTWHAGVVPGAETLQFRDVHGVSAKVAYLLSAGSGTDSRIYKTTDGGQTWTLKFTNDKPAAFYDCFDFWTPNRGLTFSDPVAGRFPVIRTTDGSTWQDIGDRMPPALDGEFAFAASGTCVATQGGQRAWIATGGSATARILATTNGGNSWNAYPTPIPSGTSPTSAAGAFTVAFRDPHHGLVAGGDFLAAGVIAPNVARSSDGGRTWQATASSAPIAGAVFGLSYVPSQGRLRVVATGPGGTAWSANEGDSWKLIEGLTNFWAVAFATHKAGWLVGTDGRIVKVSF